jgi:hypothetical protein
MVPVMQKVKPANADEADDTAEDFLFGGIML